MTLYSQTLRRLANRDDPLVPPAGVASDSQQRGASAQFNRRLSAQLSATASLRWSKITGLAARDGDVSQDASAALSLLQNLSPRTNISAGVQRTRFTSTVVGQDSTNSTLVSVGMNHRF